MSDVIRFRDFSEKFVLQIAKFLVPLALPKLLALGNKKKMSFSFVFLSFLCNFANRKITSLKTQV